MHSRKCGILGILITAGLFGGVASAGSMKELADWSALPTAILSHDVKFVMTDGSSVKTRLMGNNSTDFVVVTGKQARMTIAHHVVAEVHATIRDSSVRDYCSLALLGPIGLLMSADQNGPNCLQSALISLVVPVMLPWTAVGLATMPVMLPIKYFKSRHTYHFKLQP
jgi:hypothetical protein